METRVTASQLARCLSDILNRVKYCGEHFVVERGGEAVATIIPAEHGRTISWREFVNRLRNAPRPDDDFADDLEAVLASQEKLPPPQWPD